MFRLRKAFKLCLLSLLASLAAHPAEAKWLFRNRQAALPPIEWQTDYASAMTAARAEQKLLLVYFQGSGRNPVRHRFESVSLADARVRRMLARYVAVKVPLELRITVDGKEIELIKHAAFAEMRGLEGVAIIDLANRDSKHYGRVVTALPFAEGKFYRFRPEHLAVLLDLPPGSLTQRTLMFAVRIHPESPASTAGEVDPMLLKEAERHSWHQARIRRLGHHNWDQRFQRLSRLLPLGLLAQEVVAESWPDENLLDAAVDCVDSWRQSSGHWSAVRLRQPRFAYDMKRGSNGIWYATGLFGH